MTVIDDVSVMVPTVGRSSLRACVDSILAGSHIPSQLVIVDQSDGSWTPDYLQSVTKRGIDLRHVTAPRRGIAAARNVCFRAASRHFAVMTDDDCTVSHTWLADMRAALTAGGTGCIVSGRVLPSVPGRVPSVSPSLRERVLTTPSLRGDPLYPNNMGMDRSIFGKVGPFSESALFAQAAEDGEWIFRALRLGIRLRLSPEVVVTHHHALNDEELISIQRIYSSGSGAFYGSYLRKGEAFMLARIGVDVCKAGKNILIGTVSFQRVRVRRAFAALSGLASGLRRGWSSTDA